MAAQSRYAGSPVSTAEGWSFERLTRPSRLFGANGIAAGADGRIYIAQVGGSQVSAIQVDTGEVETISAMGGDIVAPDDLVFDESGNMYLTEITEGRVCMRTPAGKVSIVHGDIPVANPITYHQGRLIAGECRMGARIMELDRNGGAPRVILEDVPMANAFEVGPDGKLYFPVMAANEIWRVDLAGGSPEVVARDLGVPDSVKFDSRGRIVSTQVASGDVLRIDPLSGAREVLANLGPGLDNVAFIGDRMFVSSIPGEITEILGDGRVRPVVPRGLQWPLGLAIGSDGQIFVADGMFAYTLSPGSNLALAGMAFHPGSPGYVRGAAPADRAGEWIVTTGLGSIAIYRPGKGESEFLAHGFDQLMGVTKGGDGRVVVAEYGTGRLLAVGEGEVAEIASGLDRPMGIAAAPDGGFYVAEAGAGRVSRIGRDGGADIIIEGLQRPEGVAVSGGKLAVTDSKSKCLVLAGLDGEEPEVIARDLPIGAPVGITPKFLGPIGTMAGPMINFAAIAAGTDGTLFVSADAEGSVIAVKRSARPG